MAHARVRDSATTRKVRRYPPEGYTGISEGGTAVLHFNANVPRTNGPETPSPHPTPPIPKYPHLSTTTDTPVHPPARTPIPAPNPPTPPHPSQPPDTRTTHPDHTHLSPYTPPPTPTRPPNPQVIPPIPAPAHSPPRPTPVLPRQVAGPSGSGQTRPAPPKARPQHGDTRPPRPQNPPVTRYRDEVEPGFCGFPPRGTPVTPPGSWW